MDINSWSMIANHKGELHGGACAQWEEEKSLPIYLIGGVSTLLKSTFMFKSILLPMKCQMNIISLRIVREPVKNL
jgi:hypothetical protein